MRLVAAVTIVAAVIAAVAVFARSPEPAPEVAAIPQAGPPTTLPHSERDLAAAAGIPRPIAGFAIVAHHINEMEKYTSAIDQIKALGGNAVIVFTPMFVETVESIDIRFIPEKCPSDEQLATLLNHAHDAGLLTALVPTVLIERPGEKDWRGVIKPKDWDAWWTSYTACMDRFLGVAKIGHIDILAIGSELNSTEPQIDNWKAIAGRVRASFPGKITYSANWDRYEKVTFWNLVDVIGVSSYFELKRDNESAPEDELVQEWRGAQHTMLKFAIEHERPLLITEVGYPSLPWATAHPWNYVPTPGVKPDHEAQARGWRAFFRAWGSEFTDPLSPAVGFFGYAWDPYYHGDDSDRGYGILGKPAFDVVRDGINHMLRDAAEGDRLHN